MDLEAATKRPYTSRWKPAIDFEPVLTERRLEALKLLTRYTYLSSPYFTAFLGGDKRSWQEALQYLTGAGYLERPTQQRQHYNANYRPLVYALAQRGVNALQERGLECEKPRSHKNFAHELMTSELMASLELGAREQAGNGVRLITWPDILNSENLPDTTRRSSKPLHIPLTVLRDGQRIATSIAADGTPFGIQRIDDGKPGYRFCPGIEADCATEPIDLYDLGRSSIVKKFKFYQIIFDEQIHRTHFGFPNFFVPFITTNKVRMRSMMEALKRITSGKGSRIFLFKTAPAFTSFEKPLPPSGHMLTEDWQRVGHPPFNFLSS
jgi:hypothetical protein